MTIVAAELQASAAEHKSSELMLNSSLEGLQTAEQRRVLDTVAEVRKCGLESILSLPQLVVCGDQSAGKSSVLEALTEIPFPRSDNLCTRFATEIHLRRGPLSTLKVKVIPDPTRPKSEQDAIRKFEHSISDFNELPEVMTRAVEVMDISTTDELGSTKNAFTKDILSIEIEGPSRPQLTVVDIPGIIQSSTKGVAEADIEFVAEITKSYISQPRTICLAVIAATSDAGNQPILREVRKVDPQGDRTLGIITKPDRLPAGSASETRFLELARNEDVFFKLGWHVLKNRKFEESDFSLFQRNAAEETFFNTSNFKTLPKENVGIDALRKRLSAVLFEHVKKELPNLRKDLQTTLSESETQLRALGKSRSTVTECKAYLSQLSQDYWAICKAAVDGHYEIDYFLKDIDRSFDLSSASTIRRTRAVVQSLNAKFAREMELTGHKFTIKNEDAEIDGETTTQQVLTETDELESGEIRQPKTLSRKEAMDWVRDVLIRNRGKELIGNFNPLLISELLREQATNWKEMATEHVEQVNFICTQFLRLLLRDICIEDVEDRIWISQIEDALARRKKAAMEELAKLIIEVQSHPINYNHYYTETISGRREKRLKLEVKKCIEGATTTKTFPSIHSGYQNCQTTDVAAAVKLFSEKHEANMETFSCGEALDCLMAIYKVSQKVFVANVTTQVIERHIVKGLEGIFSPVAVNSLSDNTVQVIASEPVAIRRKRDFLTDRIEKLNNGQDIFRKIMGGNMK